MWGKRGEKTGGSKKEEVMLQVWGERAQEVGVSKDKGEKRRRESSPTMKSVGESERVL